MKNGRERRMKEAEMFFWGFFWGIFILGLEEISWLEKIILFAITVLVWLYYIFNPTRANDELEAKIIVKQNSRRNIMIISIVVTVSAIATVLLLRRYF